MNNSISIIIPFYNGESFYHNLIKTITLAIKKCDDNDVYFEIITIIDSINTNIEKINLITENLFLDLKNVSVINIKNEKNLGVAKSRNKAIKIAKGKYLHIIDQDDEVLDNIYKESLKYLPENNFLLFNGLMRYKNNNYNTHKIYYLPPRLTFKGLIKDDFIRSPGQVIFSKNLLKETLFPEPKIFKGADDRFFWLRLFFHNGKILKKKYINLTCYIANLHENNYSNDRENLDRSCLENWKLFLDEIEPKKHTKIINNDITRVSYKLNNNITFVSKMKGIYLQTLFNLKLSKIIRYIIKRFKI